MERVDTAAGVAEAPRSGGLAPGQWIAFSALCAGALVAMLALHGQGAASPAIVIAAWGAMTVAMMAPSALPMLMAFADVTAARAGGARGRVWAFLGGYLGVWLGVSLAFAAAQLALLAAHDGDLPLLALAGLLAVAGAYQLTPVKDACARACRSPLMFLMARWRDGAGGAARLGAEHGVDCVRCCWALMLLALGAGALAPLVMGLVMVAVAVEKLPRIGDRVTRPLGVALLVAAACVGVLGAVA